MWPFKKKAPAGRKGLVFSGSYFEMESIPENTTEGTPYRWLGENWTDVYVKDADGKLKPFKIKEFISPDSMLPDKLYRGLKWKNCVQPLFRLPQSWLDKVNMWLGIALIGILLLALYLLYTAMTGSK